MIQELVVPKITFLKSQEHPLSYLGCLFFQGAVAVIPSLKGFELISPHQLQPSI